MDENIQQNRPRSVFKTFSYLVSTLLLRPMGIFLDAIVLPLLYFLFFPFSECLLQFFDERRHFLDFFCEDRDPQPNAECSESVISDYLATSTENIAKNQEPIYTTVSPSKSSADEKSTEGADYLAERQLPASATVLSTPSLDFDIVIAKQLDNISSSSSNTGESISSFSTVSDDINDGIMDSYGSYYNRQGVDDDREESPGVSYNIHIKDRYKEFAQHTFGDHRQQRSARASYNYQPQSRFYGHSDNENYDFQYNRKRKKFSDSNFYESEKTIFPTIEEQRTLAKAISQSLENEKNANSRGFLLFMAQKKHIDFWTFDENRRERDYILSTSFFTKDEDKEEIIEAQTMRQSERAASFDTYNLERNNRSQQDDQYSFRRPAFNDTFSSKPEPRQDERYPWRQVVQHHHQPPPPPPQQEDRYSFRRPPSFDTYNSSARPATQQQDDQYPWRRLSTNDTIGALGQQQQSDDRYPWRRPAPSDNSYNSRPQPQQLQSDERYAWRRPASYDSFTSEAAAAHQPRFDERYPWRRPRRYYDTHAAHVDFLKSAIPTLPAQERQNSFDNSSFSPSPAYGSPSLGDDRRPNPWESSIGSSAKNIEPAFEEPQAPAPPPPPPLPPLQLTQAPRLPPSGHQSRLAVANADNGRKYGLMAPVASINPEVSEKCLGPSEPQNLRRRRNKTATVSTTDYQFLRNAPEKSENKNLSPEACFSLAAEVKSRMGRGGEMFAQRQKRANKFIVDDTNVKRPESSLGLYGASSNLTRWNSMQLPKPTLHEHLMESDLFSSQYATLRPNNAIFNDYYTEADSPTMSSMDNSGRKINVIRRGNNTNPEPFYQHQQPQPMAADGYGNYQPHHQPPSYQQIQIQPQQPPHLQLPKQYNMHPYGADANAGHYYFNEGQLEQASSRNSSRSRGSTPKPTWQQNGKSVDPEFLSHLSQTVPKSPSLVPPGMQEDVPALSPK